MTMDTIRLKSFDLATQDIQSVPVQALHALSIGVSWPHRPADWDLLRALGHGFVARDEIDRVFSSAMWFPHGSRCATIGMVITSPRVQAHGGGQWMMERILHDCGDRWLMLNSTRAAVQLYLSLGFEPKATVFQCQGIVGAQRPLPPVGAASIVPLDMADLEEITTLDAAAFGAERPDLIRRLAEAPGAVIRGIRAGRHLSAFAIRRAFGRGQVIGPIVAESEEDAVRLVAALLEGMENRFVRVDTRQPDGPLRTHLLASGLPLFDTVRTMVRGGALPPVLRGQPSIYGLAGHAVS